MSIFHNNVLAGASGATGASAFQIDRSLRFNDDDSAYLSRTPSSAGNRKTWTWSAWVKRANLGYQIIFAARSGQNYHYLSFDTNDELAFRSYSSGWQMDLQTTAKFRDPSAWYHILINVDTTASTSSDRASIYINGTKISAFNTATYPSQNTDLQINATYEHNIGRFPVANDQGDFMLAEVHFVDGTALAPTDFGEPDDDNNWNPKAYSGTYGTNGFHLDFSDNSSNSALGDDSSGNNNDWTVNNIAAREEKWSDYMTTTGTFLTNNGPDKSFDNSLSAADVPALEGGQTITWAPPGGLAYSSKVEIYVGGISGFTYSFNGATAVTATNNAWNTVDTGSGTINSLVFDRGINETHGPHAIRVDNVVLVDGTPSNTDSLIDTPTNYEADSGNNGGNYCTWNPLAREASRFTFANGNLNVSGNAQNYGISGTLFVGGSGKYYFELTSNSSVTYPVFGIVSAEAVANDMVDGSIADGLELGGPVYGFMPGYGPRILTQTTTTTWSGVSQSTPTSGDVYGVAVDFDNGAIYFSKNGTFLNSGDPTSGSTKTGAAFTSISAGDYTVLLHDLGSSDNIDFDLNAGQRSFSNTPPTGYKSLCTQNLPDPTIADGSTAMDIDTYTGNNTTHERSEFSFSPDFVWIKRRNGTNWHQLFDTVRGATKRLYSNETNTEDTASGSLDSFDSDGFTLGSDGAVNNGSSTYVAWAWDAGTTTASNTNGEITSSVRANQSAGFSIVTYTADAPNNTIGHGLNAVPYFVITKARDRTDNWLVYHRDLGVNKWLHLNLASAVVTTSGIWGATSDWTNNTFGVSTNSIEGNNYGSHDYVAYCFAPVAGYSAFGSYTGTGSADGPFVYTGFRPRFLMWKPITGSTDWVLVDSARNKYNVLDKYLLPNTNGAEGTLTLLDFCSNGFKLRTSSVGNNTSGVDVVWAAFAEHPFKTARAR